MPTCNKSKFENIVLFYMFAIIWQRKCKRLGLIFVFNFKTYHKPQSKSLQNDYKVLRWTISVWFILKTYIYIITTNFNRNKITWYERGKRQKEAVPATWSNLILLNDILFKLKLTLWRK